MDQAKLYQTEKIQEWQELTGADFQKMDRKATVVLVTCSPLEVHGPHLPTITDNLEGEALALMAAEQLTQRHPELRFVHLPPLYVATDVVPRAGSLSFRTNTIRDVLLDLGRTLARQGFHHIWVSNFHGGPRHFVTIDTACQRVSRSHKVQMVSIFGMLMRRLTGGSTDIKHLISDIVDLPEEALAGDTHGGLIETSLLLHIVKNLVHPGYTSLKRRTIDELLAEKGQKRNHKGLINNLRMALAQLHYWQDETYAGDPAAASAERGERILKRFTELATDGLDDLYLQRIDPREWTSPLYPYRHIFLNRALGAVLERIVGFQSEVA